MRFLVSIMLGFGIQSCAVSSDLVDHIYLVHFQSSDIGEVDFYLQLTPRNGEIIGGSLLNEYKVNYNWFDRMKLSFFGGLKDDRLIRVKGYYEDSINTRKFRTSFNSPLGGFYFKGIIKNDAIHGILTNRKGEKRGTINGHLSTSRNIEALRDYKNVSQDFIKKFNSTFFDPSYLKVRSYRKFTKKLEQYASLSRDDLHFVFSFYFYSRSLPYSHIGLWRESVGDEGVDDGEPISQKAEALEDIAVEFSAGNCILTIRTFECSISKISATMRDIIERKPENLIIDLRDNSGGNVGPALELAKYLVQVPTFGGYFLTRNHFKNNTDGLPQNCKEIVGGDINDFFKSLSQNPCLRLRLIPNSKDSLIHCPIYLLINDRTASTCEPLAYGLKQAEKVRLVGQATAGKMLSAKEMVLVEGFVAAIPNADFRTESFERLDQVGVSPDIYVKKGDDILKACLELL